MQIPDSYRPPFGGVAVFAFGRKFSMTQTSLCDRPAENATRWPSGEN
jgi:hypothetical protein